MALDPSAFAASRVNFSPLLQAIQGYRQGMDANFDFRGQQELGAALASGNMQGARDAAGKYGMDTNVLLTLGEKARQEQERQRMAEALKNPNLTRGMSPAYMAALEALPPEQRAAHLAQAQSPVTQSQLAGQAISRQLTQAQLAQAKSMTPESRAQLAQQYGLTGEGARQFILTGQMKEENPITPIIREMAGEFKQPQSGPPAALSPSPAQPGPRLIPQSFDGAQQGDPNLINVQQPVPSQFQPQTQAPKMVQTPMGAMPEDKAKRLGFALALAGKGDAGKMLAESNPDAIGKEGGNLIDKNSIGQFDAIGRLESMAAEYDPKLQTKQARLGQWFNQQLAGWGALPPQKQQELTQFVQQRAAAINNFNLRLKEASGTAVSAQEFERNQAELPNPGTGIANGVFDGDDPVTYAAKMRKGISLLKMGMARNLYLKNQGFRGSIDEAARVIPVEQMPGVINKRGAEIEQQLLQANPKADRTSIDRAVKDALKKEFGI